MKSVRIILSVENISLMIVTPVLVQKIRDLKKDQSQQNTFLLLNLESAVIEEPIAIEEPVTLQSKLFSLQLEDLKAPNFKNNEPVEVCLKTIKENLQIIHNEMEECVLSSSNYDNKSKLLEKQLTTF